MQIVDVIPITKSFGKETLSYFCAKKTTLGSLVQIPLRKKKVLAVVVAQHSVSKVKAALKSADFTLRNVQEVHTTTPFSDAFLRACIRVKNYSLTRLGAVISEYMPQLLLDDSSHWIPHRQRTHEHSNILPERYIFQAPPSERITYYKTYIREHFANSASVFFIAPTRAHLEYIYEHIQKGIKDRVYILHSGLSNKKITETLQEIHTSKQPLVIIGTTMFCSVARDDIETYVIEFESSRYYIHRPGSELDDRHFVTALAYETNKKLIYADTMLQFSTLEKAQQQHYYQIKPISFRLKNIPTVETAAWKKDTDKEFSSITPTSLRQIKKNYTQGSSTLVFVRRKGFAPITVCKDCGTTVTNPKTGAPLVLHKRKVSGKIQSLYIDPKTKEEVTPSDACSACKGWRLQALGIGTERVAEDIQKELSDIPVYVLDSTTGSTYNKTKKILDTWNSDAGSVLVATEKVIPHLVTPHTTIIASLESLVAIPHYQAFEQVLQTLATLAQHTQEMCVIQTKDIKHPIVDALYKKNSLDIYQNELIDRKQFNFPPYFVIFTIIKQGTKKSIELAKTYLQKLFEEYEPTLHIFATQRKNTFELSAQLYVNRAEWSQLYGTTKTLPETYRKIRELAEQLPPGYKFSITRS